MFEKIPIFSEKKLSEGLELVILLYTQYSTLGQKFFIFEKITNFYSENCVQGNRVVIDLIEWVTNTGSQQVYSSWEYSKKKVFGSYLSGRFLDKVNSLSIRIAYHRTDSLGSILGWQAPLIIKCVTQNKKIQEKMYPWTK